MDFTGVLAALNVDAVVGGLTAIAAIKILPGVARWGYNKVIGWFDARDLKRRVQEFHETGEFRMGGCRGGD